MKKYILKKYIPAIPQGTEAEYVNGNVYIHIHGERITVGHFDQNIGEWLEEVPEKPKSVWELKEGDTYYYIYSSSSTIGDDTYKYSSIYRNRVLSGNVFLTQEEAKKEISRRQAIAKIHKWCWENGIERKYCRDKRYYIVIINYYDDIDYTSGCRNGNPIGYFSREDAQKIIEQFPDELRIILEG